MAPRRASLPRAVKRKKVEVRELSVGKRKADVHYDFEVYENYECTLNQTNTEDNNNKFYTIKVLTDGHNYWCRRKYGRVGLKGTRKDHAHHTSPIRAVALFEETFRAKTGNNWIQRNTFVPHKKKYILIKLLREERFRPKRLDRATCKLIDLIFAQKAVQESMNNMRLDTQKIPLGSLSKQQIIKGHEILIRIQRALQEQNQRRLQKLSSMFYSNIPHNFGRKNPPVINKAQIIEDERVILMALEDIVFFKRLTARKRTTRDEQISKLDLYYNSLNCELRLLRRDNGNFQMIENYLKKTACSPMPSITNIWEVNRANEGERFCEHNGVENRKLLWHGTKVSSVVAILKEGLRIMPWSGGRVGKGIYFASEAYVSLKEADAVKNDKIMFLNEIVLGREAIITEDDRTLTKPPEGYDSVVARGKTEPDPTKDIVVELDGKEVDVPQGKPVPQPEYRHSRFSQSEYLIYKESQCRIRYLVLLKNNN